MSLELRNVTKRVGAETYIHPTSLKLDRGSFNILLGTTLAGKTTLMKLMAGLERPTTGEVWFDGNDVTGVNVRDRNVSMVYQQFINYPNLSVFENIASPLRVAGVPRSDIRDRVEQMASLLKLGRMLKRRPNELSGGQQQRTALARALVKESDLVLLDEPLANLDFKLREEMRDELPRLFAGRNAVVVYATTEPVEALLFGGRTATMHEGRVTQFGPTGTIYRRPEDITSAKVFSEPPINTATVEKRGSEFVLGDRARWQAGAKTAVLGDGTYLLGIRPHHVTPVEAGARPVMVEGNVLVTELSGSESIVHFEMGGTTWISQSHGIHPFRVGERARLYADMEAAMVFHPDGRLLAA